MKTYTIESGKIEEGILVIPRVLASGASIACVEVGEKGRGRQLSFIPVELSTSRKTFETEGKVKINNVELGKTQKGGHKLLETNHNINHNSCLIVFKTKIGFRGGNSHTGDRIPDSDPLEFFPFPGQILTKGTIAQGDAGKMGSGTQLIAIVDKGAIFRTAYSGRLYGAPSSHYYLFNGEQIIVATWDERVANDDLF